MIQIRQNISPLKGTFGQALPNQPIDSDRRWKACWHEIRIGRQANLQSSRPSFFAPDDPGIEGHIRCKKRRRTAGSQKAGRRKRYFINVHSVDWLIWKETDNKDK